MHVVNGTILSTDLSDGQTVNAINTEELSVTIGDSVVISTADSNGTVVAPDIMSSDGVVHKINGVLVPSFLSTGLIDLTQSVEGFSTLLKLLEFAGLTGVVGSNVTATVFAPNDDAFKKLPDGAVEYYLSNKGSATALLFGHVITPRIIPTQNMETGDLPFTTAAKTTLTVEIMEVDGAMVYKINNATIVTVNVLASNGIIHELDTVLAVSGAEYPPKPTAPSTPTATPPTAAKPPTSSAMSTTLIMATMTSFFGWLLMA